jgi:hypothetical protein
MTSKKKYNTEKNLGKDLNTKMKVLRSSLLVFFLPPYLTKWFKVFLEGRRL